jgi:preprotein translocase subunit YajC
MTALILIIALLVLMWLFLIRPQRRRQLQQRQLLTEVDVGDEIVTAGGLYGTVRAVDEDELRLEIAPGTVVRVARRAVAGVFKEEDEEPADGTEDGA